jgi:hypothetical protein
VQGDTKFHCYGVQYHIIFLCYNSTHERAFNDEVLKQGVPNNSKLRARAFGVWIPVEANDLSVLPTVQTDSGAHQASYSIGTGVLSPGIGRPARETDHSPPYNAGIKNDWKYTSTPCWQEKLYLLQFVK